MAGDPDGDRRLRTTPPPRPGMSYLAPAPIPGRPALPRLLKLARTLWLVSFVAGLGVVVTSFLAREGHVNRVRTLVDQMVPGGQPGAMSTTAAIVFTSSLGSMLLVVFLEAASLWMVLRRRVWLRRVMIVLLLGQIAAAFMMSTFLVPDANASKYVVLLWGVQLPLAFAGLVLLFVPSSQAWLRSEGNV